MKLEEGGIFAEHYQLQKQLGHGSFGDVWLAHNLLADIDVAIKFYGTFDEAGLEGFRNEFKVAYKLNHPNLLNISHFDVYESCPYLVMPYCANGSVAKRIGKMSEDELWKFVRDVSAGLAFLHSQKPPIIHQDIKPDNILITTDGRYVISDFGISRNLRTQMSRTMNNQMSSGTLAYMGPERFSEEPLIVLASDIWAFGMTLYEAITGNVLWEGMGGCVQLNGARIPTIDRISPAMAQLVSSCLAPETWDRPTAIQICEYATAYIQNQPLPRLHKTVAASNTPPQPAPQQPAPPQPVIIPHTSSPKAPEKANTTPAPDWKKRGIILAAVFLAVLAIGGGIYLFSQSISEQQDYISCKTVQDFQRFIEEHPNSTYVPAARTRIAALTPRESTKEEDVPEETVPEAPHPAPVKTTVVSKRPSTTHTAQPVARPKNSNDADKGKFLRERHDYSEEYLPGYEGNDIVNADNPSNQHRLPRNNNLLEERVSSHTSVHVSSHSEPSMGYRSGGSHRVSGSPRSGASARSGGSPRSGGSAQRSSSTRSSSQRSSGGMHRRR